MCIRDRLGLEFQQRVAAGMGRYVERAPLAVGIDGRGSEAEVAERVLAAVLESATAQEAGHA